MPHAEAASSVSLDEQAQSACLALGDDEHRRWRARCLALEGGEGYPWGTSQSRAFVGSILACLFSEDLSTLDGPARSWARTNTTMAVFTRRLGCLRELIGEEAFLNGRESADRLGEIFDKVTIIATEAALSSLSFSDGPAIDALPNIEESSEAGNFEPAGEQSATTGASKRRRMAMVAGLGAALAALIAGAAFALSTSSHPAVGAHKAHHHTNVVHGKGTPVPSTGGPAASHSGNGSGVSGASGSGSSTNGTGQGRAGAARGSKPGHARTGSIGTGTGTRPGPNTGSGSNTGGSPLVTLPGGTPVTTPAVTVPGGTGGTVPGTNL